MFSQTFYHKTIRKYVTLFGTLFNDIYINRVDSSNNNVQTLKIPITYGPKNKALLRLDSDPLLNRPFNISVPVMSFEITDLSYAPDRKLNTIRKHNITLNPNNLEQQKYVYNPVPYDIGFNLYILTKNAEDGTRILEQILPYFTPDWTVTVNLIPEADVKLDIPIIIKNVSSEDTYEGGAEEKRTIMWTLSFTLKGYMFGPVRKSEIITLANTNFYNDTTNVNQYLSVAIYPGLLANGSPTTNASLTIPRDEINEDDDWDYIVIRSDKVDE